MHDLSRSYACSTKIRVDLQGSEGSSGPSLRELVDFWEGIRWVSSNESMTKIWIEAIQKWLIEFAL